MVDSPFLSIVRSCCHGEVAHKSGFVCACMETVSKYRNQSYLRSERVNGGMCDRYHSMISWGSQDLRAFSEKGGKACVYWLLYDECEIRHKVPRWGIFARHKWLIICSWYRCLRSILSLICHHAEMQCSWWSWLALVSAAGNTIGHIFISLVAV
jgi:hypothetical protein